jgi:hypothetical protein
LDIYIYKDTNFNRSGNRLDSYLIYDTKTNISNKFTLHSPPKLTFQHRYNHNDIIHPKTPSDKGHSRYSISTCDTSKMSDGISQCHLLSSRNSTTSPHITQLIDKFPILHKHGISLDFEDPNNIHTIQSIMKELEVLSKTHDLFFKRYNNTLAKPFFVPNGLRSSKSFNEWESKGGGFCSIIDFMFHGIDDATTNEPITVLYLMKVLSKYYPNTYQVFNHSMGYRTYK